ncbi:MAG: metal-dependent hydrolase [Casimicrobium sp.]
MSSVVGHALVGASVFLVTNRVVDRRSLPALAIFVLLAICPDFDYFAIWLWGWVTTPRVTHTLLFCVIASVIAWRCTKRMRSNGDANVSFLALLAASTSHLLLDLFVGAHSLPLLWPLPSHDVSAPIGLLPSAARLRHGNYYLWRNLLIEISVLLPLCAFAIALTRDVSYRAIAKCAIFISPAWGFALAWSIALPR